MDTANSSCTADGPKNKTSYRIGFWIPEKKSRKFKEIEFLDICRSSGLDIIQIDLTRSLEEQGPFTLILHKLTDVIAKANCGDITSGKIIRAFEDYLYKHSEVVMVDPLENVLALLDRNRTYNLISDSQLSKEHVLCTPAFVELNCTDQRENMAKLKAAGVDFPIICKPTVAHGSTLAHQMVLIFHEDGLKDISPPCVAQMFVNHDAVLFKLYVIGEKWFMVERPSLKNFYPSATETIFFDSHEVSKADSDCLLNKLDEKDQGRNLIAARPDDDRLQEIVSTVRQTLNMGLFGIDVVIDNRTGSYAIVDINAFPGYDGVPEFPQLLIQYMLEQIKEQREKKLLNFSHIRACVKTQEGEDQPSVIICDRPSEGLGSSPSIHDKLASMAVDTSPEDSGIETGDSSDEKKNKLNKMTSLAKVTRRLHSKGAPVTT